MRSGGGWLGSPWLLLCLSLLAGGTLVGVVAWRHASPRRPADGPKLDGWDIGQLVRRLGERGIRLRRLSASRHYVTEDSAYLTLTDAPFESLDTLAKRGGAPDPRWNGSLFCALVRNPEARAQMAQLWEDEDGPPVVGPFVFYGDRRLLARVREVLADEP
jgi:hypothetical protein